MNEVSKKLKCVVMRNGVEIWKEEDRLANLTTMLTGSQKVGFIKVDNETINSVDIVGIFSPETMDEMTRRKNGQWKCNANVWHNKGEKCECVRNTMSDDERKRQQAELAGDDISEEERMNNLKAIDNIRNKHFKN